MEGVINYEEEYLIFTLALLLLGAESTICVYAEDMKSSTQKVEIAINEKNFPNRYLREEVLEKVDCNKDGYLQKEEIEQTTKFSLFVEFDYSKDTDKGKEATIIDCKGIEYLTNIEELYLSNLIYGDYTGKRGYLNFNKIYQLKKLKKLTIGGDNQVKNWRFDKLPKLKRLELTGISNVKK